MITSRSSLLRRCCFPVQQIPSAGIDGHSQPLLGPPIDYKVYYEGHVTRVIDRKGIEVTSSCQLYIPGDRNITLDDHFVFNSTVHVIKSLSDFVTDGVRVYWVVYL